MKKLLYIFLILTAMLMLCSCSILQEQEAEEKKVDLEEYRYSGLKFSDEPQAYECTHGYYSYSIQNKSDIYDPNSAISHYKVCTGTFRSGCTKPAISEVCTGKLVMLTSATPIRYNGHSYHTAVFDCNYCSRRDAKTVYVICSQNRAYCSGYCDSGMEYMKAHGLDVPEE